jgi:hypothetical protein
MIVYFNSYYSMRAKNAFFRSRVCMGSLERKFFFAREGFFLLERPFFSSEKKGLERRKKPSRVKKNFSRAPMQLEIEKCFFVRVEYIVFFDEILKNVWVCCTYPFDFCINSSSFVCFRLHHVRQ